MEKVIFRLYTQYPEVKEIGAGRLDVNETSKVARFFSPDGDQVLSKMSRVTLAFAASDGIMLSGMEFFRIDKGRELYQYQEWWLSYI